MSKLQKKQVLGTPRLPKQWKRWLSAAGLRLDFGRGRFLAHQMKGRGRYWRINMHGELQCSDKYAEFDRWANSTAVTAIMNCTSQQDFVALVRLMTRCAAEGFGYVSDDWRESQDQAARQVEVISRITQGLPELNVAGAFTGAAWPSREEFDAVADRRENETGYMEIPDTNRVVGIAE